MVAYRRWTRKLSKDIFRTALTEAAARLVTFLYQVFPAVTTAGRAVDRR
jgi:hypothetical protein